jgi:NADPH-dependent 2,4-dienoyl-CoA reductase/sulfur reductase-like enzyme/rhodanese-related sulfurtransferase
MKNIKLVIVGGVAGGAGSAAKARRVNETASIKMFEKGSFVSFANCGLPYFVGDEIKSKSSLLLQTPEKFWNRYRIEAKVNHEVLSINRKEKNVKVKNLETNEEFTEDYDKLILSPGAGAIVPPIEGIHSKNIFVLKTVPDAEKIKEYIQKHNVKKAVVVGAGFIGLEIADQLNGLKIETSVIELFEHVLPPFDKDMAMLIQQKISNSNVKFIINDGVKSFKVKDEIATHVETQSGKLIESDLVLLCIGVRPEIKLAQDCGLEIGKTKGIVTNEYMQTSDPDIYAVGDAVEVKNLITGEVDRFALAGPAAKQGRCAGENAVTENRMKFKGSIGTAIIESCGVTCAMSGLSEKACQRANIPYKVNVIHAESHVSYYPGSNTLCLKLVSHAKTGQILGGQIVGIDGVDKRMDVIATAIYAKMTTHDLEFLDLCYSPQFGSSKDPVVMLGFSSHDTECGDVQGIPVLEFLNQSKDYEVVDVRTPNEYKNAHMKGASNIELDSIRENLEKFDKKKEYVLYCRSGFRSYMASRVLKQNGFKVKNLQGGFLSLEPVLSKDQVEK